jgi:hypothetical protein
VALTRRSAAAAWPCALAARLAEPAVCLPVQPPAAAFVLRFL